MAVVEEEAEADSATAAEVEVLLVDEVGEAVVAAAVRLAEEEESRRVEGPAVVGGEPGVERKLKGLESFVPFRWLIFSSKVIVEPHRHTGVFVARGKEDLLVTKNLVCPLGWHWPISLVRREHH